MFKKAKQNIFGYLFLMLMFLISHQAFAEAMDGILKDIGNLIVLVLILIISFCLNIFFLVQLIFALRSKNNYLRMIYFAIGFLCLFIPLVLFFSRFYFVFNADLIKMAAWLSLIAFLANSFICGIIFLFSKNRIKNPAMSEETKYNELKDDWF